MTLSSLRTDLASARAFSTDEPDTSTRNAIVNEALARLINSGRFVGARVVLNISVNSSGVLTLPRMFQTLLGVKVNGFQRDLAGIWYTFQEGTSDLSQFSYDIVDQGEGYPTYTDPSTACRLRITSSGASGTVRVQGNDQASVAVFNVSDGTLGFDLTFGVTSTQYVSTLTKVIMPVTTGYKTLTAYYDDGSTSVLGIYEPGETDPSYRRYYVGEATQQDPNTLESAVVTALCKRKHVKLVSDNDPVFTENFGAVKNAVLSVHFENESDEDRSASHFNTAIKLLNDESRSNKPDTEVGMLRINYIGDAGGSRLYSRL